MSRDARPVELPDHNFSQMDLGRFIEVASSGEFKAPIHLGEYYELMKDLDATGRRLCVSMPPQHAKSTTCHYAIALALLKNPRLKFGYCSYAKEFANDQTRKIRDIFLACGGEIQKDANKKEHWVTESGGGLLAGSPSAGITGHRLDVLVCDDIVQDAQSIETEAARNKVWDWTNDVAKQRVWIGGSVIVIGTRWHPDDPIGRLILSGFKELNLPAIREDEDGSEYALWPEVKPISWLNLKRQPTLEDGMSNPDYLGEYAWYTQFQGKPIAREGAIFGTARYYDSLPVGAVVNVIGIDMGYGPEGTSDYSVAVAMAQHNGIYYVHEVKRIKTTLEHTTREFKEMMYRFPYPCRYGSYMSGPEKGILNQLFNNDVSIERMPARHNKWTRAQRCAVAWRSGRILVRSGQPWSSKFAKEVEYFTGDERGYDDQVDALVSGFDLIETSAPAGWASNGFKFGKVGF